MYQKKTAKNALLITNFVKLTNPLLNMNTFKDCHFLQSNHCLFCFPLNPSHHITNTRQLGASTGLFSNLSCLFFRSAVQNFSFVLTDLDAHWTFGFCRIAPKSETALVSHRHKNTLKTTVGVLSCAILLLD